jgi:hypothetical protein
MVERNIPVALVFIPSRASKEIRAPSIAAHAATRGLFLRANAPYVSDFTQEWCGFPLFRTDDMIDCCSLLGQLISRLAPGSAPTPKEEQKRLVIGGPGTNICMEDLWREEERRSSKYRSSGRIR